MNNKKMSSGQITGVGCDVTTPSTASARHRRSRFRMTRLPPSPRPSARPSVRAAAATDFSGHKPLHNYFRKSAIVFFISCLSTTSSKRFSRLSRPSSGFGIAVFVTSESFSISSVPEALLPCPSASRTLSQNLYGLAVDTTTAGETQPVSLR